MRNEISNGDDIIDSRNVIARLAELQEQKDDAGREDAEGKENLPLTDEEEAERKSLADLNDAGEQAFGREWEHGVTLIRDGDFEQYARELAEDIGAINKDAKWPNDHIDWKAAAEALRQDYTAIDFDGETYWGR